MSEWTKAIPESRDRLQSRVLVWVVGVALLAGLLLMLTSLGHALSCCKDNPSLGQKILLPVLVSLTFGGGVLALRAATPFAALLGTLIAFAIAIGTSGLLHSCFPSLLLLFVLTYASTRAGKRRKQAADSLELKRGRNAAQIVANLGAAGLVASQLFDPWIDLLTPPNSKFPVSFWLVPIMVLGCLAEATADTVSSEIGAAFGRQPFLVTTWRRVEPGTDGAVSLLGTLAGCLGAAIVVGVGVWAMGLSAGQGLAAFAGGVAGLWFDSLLGATVERKGWLGNDLVNFLSTVVGGAVALGVGSVLR